MEKEIINRIDAIEKKIARMGFLKSNKRKHVNNMKNLSAVVCIVILILCLYYLIFEGLISHELIVSFIGLLALYLYHILLLNLFDELIFLKDLVKKLEKENDPS